MSGSQIFVLVFMIGGAIGMGFFLMGLGVFYWGRSLVRELGPEAVMQELDR